jgi:hypothetical protein
MLKNKKSFFIIVYKLIKNSREKIIDSANIIRKYRKPCMGRKNFNIF